MSARPKKTKALGTLATPAATLVRPLKAFYHGGGGASSFGFARFYWPPSEGDREPIAPRLTKKRRPAGEEATTDTAAGVDVLLHPDAPQDYKNIDFLMRHYEDSLSRDETIAFVQVTIRFGDCVNLHAPYEIARAWFKSFYCDDEDIRAPVILILHAPHLAGSSADGHVHGLILPRRLSRYGWMGMVRDVGSDAAAIKARESWERFRDARDSS